MNTLGSHPGAILFRFSIMVILIAIMISIFLSYVARAERGIERASVEQTRKIINSALAVTFSSHAINLRLDDLNQLDGGNPFPILQQYQMLPSSYRGAIQQDLSATLEPGWYYLALRRLVAYKPIYGDSIRYYRVVLDYDDNDHSGKFESRQDRFNRIGFDEVLETGS